MYNKNHTLQWTLHTSTVHSTQNFTLLLHFFVTVKYSVLYERHGNKPGADDINPPPSPTVQQSELLDQDALQKRSIFVREGLHFREAPL